MKGSEGHSSLKPSESTADPMAAPSAPLAVVFFQKKPSRKIATMPGVKFVKSGSLDDASWMQPQMVLWCDSAQPWVAMPDDLAQHARNPG